MKITSIEEMQKFAGDFAKNIKSQEHGATIVALSGELGAGKTTFTQSVALGLGVQETVQSPTFVIMKIYELTGQKFKHLIHIDAYRLEKSEELLKLGWQEIISDPENLVLIEWPEKVDDILPEHTTIHFKHVSEMEREVEVI